MNRKIIKICEWATVVLALIGIMVIGNTIHELTHYYDAINQNATVTSVCFLKLPLNENQTISFKENIGEVNTAQEINSPEWKALTIQFIFMIILAIIMMIGFWMVESR